MSAVLGELIEVLEVADPATIVPVGIANPQSWRGDYSELAFEPAPPMSIGEALAVARSALGQTYQGYKGGDYEMNQWTPVHLSFYGRSSDYFPLVALAPGAALVKMRSDDPLSFDEAGLRLPDEMTGLLEAALSSSGWSLVRTEGLEAARDIADGPWIVTDGETGAEWCHWCDMSPDYKRGKPVERHRDDCDIVRLRRSLTSPSPEEPG